MAQGKTSRDKTIHCFFSGGRDSALACYIAHRVASQRGWDFRLVHIDTTISLRATQEYVRRYAEWLGVELIVIRPEKTFKEYAAKHGMWPSLYPQKYRWCYFCLKLDPTVEYLEENYKERDIVTLGVRGPESRFRLGRYTSAFFIREYNRRLKVLAWAPLWKVTGEVVETLIRHYNIPRSPVWKYGFSGECLCLAGAPLNEIAIILRHFPEEAHELLEIDDIIQKNRKSVRPGAPFRVSQAGFPTLRAFYEHVMKQQTLDMYMKYTGKACQGSCLL